MKSAFRRCNDFNMRMFLSLEWLWCIKSDTVCPNLNGSNEKLINFEIYAKIHKFVVFSLVRYLEIKKEQNNHSGSEKCVR